MDPPPPCTDMQCPPTPPMYHEGVSSWSTKSRLHCFWSSCGQKAQSRPCQEYPWQLLALYAVITGLLVEAPLTEADGRSR